ncbi:MAG: hypothetical protein J5738_01470 [Lachnospiraceae bacterium]|nr:hypothetical protein [Lachnospiraceae bacterium]
MKYIRRAGIALSITVLAGCLLCGIAAAGSDVGPTATPTPTPAGIVIGDSAQEPGLEEPVPTMSPWDMELANTYKALEAMKTDGTAGYGGYWKDADTEPGAFFIGVTKDADREKILARIPDSFRDWIRFVDVQYSYTEIWNAYQEIVKKYFLDIADADSHTDPEKQELAYAGVSESRNTVVVGVINDLPKERQDRVIAELFDRYGSKIIIELADRSEAEDGYLFGEVGGKEIWLDGMDRPIYGDYTAQAGPYINVTEIVYTDYLRKDRKKTGLPLPVILAAAAVFAAGLGALYLGLARAKRRAALTADGRTVTADASDGDREIEELFKRTSGDVSEAGRERIFEAYERERQDNK